MNKIKVLIVDDEELARKNLEFMLNYSLRVLRLWLKLQT